MADPSSFRLFLHVQTGSADGDLRGWRERYGVVPAWVKVFGREHCAEVKGIDPRVGTLLRYQELSEDDRYLAGPQAGRDFVTAAKERSGGTFDDVDALEFMNEKIAFDDVAALEANNAAALGFVEACAAERVRPVIHNAAFANPRPDLIAHLAPSIQAALDAGGYFACHCYGPADLFDSAAYYVECYLAQLRELARAGVNVPPERVLITEFGHDVVSDPNYKLRSGAWRKLGLSPSHLQQEYVAYEAALAQHGIAGAFMYNVYGYPGDEYELFPSLRDWYGQQLDAHRGQGPQPVHIPPAVQTLYAIGQPFSNLRSAPQISPDTVIASVYPGAPVECLEQQGSWCQVRIHATAGGARVDVTGWMHVSVLAPEPP